MKQEMITNKQISLWHKFVAEHFQARKKLIKDVGMCKAVLSANAYKSFRCYKYDPKILKTTKQNMFTAVIGNKSVTSGRYWRSFDRPYAFIQYLSNGVCFGEPDRISFTSKIKKMKYLSQFLAELPHFIATK